MPDPENDGTTEKAGSRRRTVTKYLRNTGRRRPQGRRQGRRRQKSAEKPAGIAKPTARLFRHNNGNIAPHNYNNNGSIVVAIVII